MTATAIRHLGTCPVCEGKFKARTIDAAGALALVHHGYKRPGNGSIQGDCFAVGMPPYERSAEGCVAYRAELIAHRVQTATDRDRLIARAMIELLEEVPDYDASYIRGRRATKLQTYTRDDAATGRDYERVRRSRIGDFEHRIKVLTLEIERMDRLIAAWTLREVEAWSEAIEAAKKKAERDARAAERNAKRDARARERAARDAKAAALVARRMAIQDDFAARFRALAATPSDEAKAEARKLARRLRSKAMDWLWIQHLGVDAELATLGLATLDPVQPRFPHYHF